MPADPRLYPTLETYSPFNAEKDCTALRDAMKGLGTDEQAIIDILAHRSANQRVELVEKYKSMFGKDLIASLKSELSGHFEEVVLAMTCTLDELDAKALRQALKGAGTDEDMLIQILCSRDNVHIEGIKKAYAKLFDGRSLEEDIIGDTSGDFRNILVSLVQGKRETNRSVDSSAVHADVQALIDAGVNKFGTDEAVFNRILATKSEPHIKAVIAEYEKSTGIDFEETLKSELSGDTLKSFLAITRCVLNKPKYLATLLRRSMEGAGTTDHMLIHLIVSRCEIDLGHVKQEFQNETGKTLAEWIEGDVSGDYKRMLLALVGN